MSNLKNTISKSITTINMKTNNFVEQNKIRTYITTLENEIAGLKSKIGDVIYCNWKSGNVDIKDVEKYLTLIKEKEGIIDQQNEKIREMELQEQQILKGDVDGGASVIYCSMCGAENRSGYKFCVKCGKEL